MNRQKQGGAVLVISLLLLIVMTLLAVSSIKNSNVNLLVLRNMQSQQHTLAASQQAIDELVSDETSFTKPDEVTTSVTIDGLPVSRETPVCLDAQVADGYSATVTLAPEDTTWELVASATDNATGATTTVHQGIMIRLDADNCP